jgi:hypothetical protein
MAQRQPLDIGEFLAGAEMIFAYLRVKEADVWSESIGKLKFASFKGSFPEVDREQFLWACEMWVQESAGKEFLKFPTWAELMAPLYGCENGLANRSYGFKLDLPAFLRPTPQQLAMLPKERMTLKPHPGEAYRLLPAAGPLLLPKHVPARGLTDEQWEAYLAGGGPDA